MPIVPRRIALIAGAAVCLLTAGSRVTAAQTGRRMVTGTVTDSAGTPIANAEVYVSDDSSNTRTDATGHYRLRVIDKGIVPLTARYFGYAPAKMTALVPDSGTVTLDFQLARQAQSLADIKIIGHEHGLSGIVVNEDGAPIPGAQVWMLGRGAHISTDAQGKFAISITHTGFYVINALKMGYQPAHTSIKLDYEKGGRAVVTLTSLPSVLPKELMADMSGFGIRQVAMGELDTRISWGVGYRGGFIISREELSHFGGMGLQWLVCRVRDAASRGFECPVQPTCVLVDGYQRSYGGFDAFTADQVEMVELYMPYRPLNTSASINSKVKQPPPNGYDKNQQNLLTAVGLSLNTRGCSSQKDTTAVVWKR